MWRRKWRQDQNFLFDIDKSLPLCRKIDFTKFRNFLQWRHSNRKLSKMNSSVDFELFRHIWTSFKVKFNFYMNFVTCYDDVTDTGNHFYDDQWPRFSVVTKFHKIWLDFGIVGVSLKIIIFESQIIDRYSAIQSHKILYQNPWSYNLKINFRQVQALASDLIY